MLIPDEHRDEGAAKFGRPNSFVGVSAFRNESDAESLHEAVQEAAMAAVKGLGLGPGDFQDFDISRVRIRVGGNPNVKVYCVEITPSG